MMLMSTAELDLKLHLLSRLEGEGFDHYMTRKEFEAIVDKIILALRIYYTLPTGGKR